MECCVYVKQEFNNLRQVIITQKNINNGYALKLYKHYSTMNNMYVANYVPTSHINLNECKCYSDGIYGCLGLICVKNETFLALVTQIDNLGVFDGKTIYRITDVAFISLNDDLYDFSLDKRLQALMQDDESNSGLQNHPCLELIKYLSRGTFYYSNDFDLTQCAQNRYLQIGTKKSLSYLESANSNFFWNKYLLKELLNFRKHLLDIEKLELDRSGILLVVIQGFVSISNIRTVDDEAQMCLISRLSCKRVGTRYNARGIDDDGNVANFVESEILFHNYEYYFSFLQIRGSVPLFWEQPQTTQMTHKIELSRGMESSAPAFKRHFEKMIKKYGHVYIINLLSRKEGTGENVLGMEFEKHYRNSTQGIKSYINKLDFDFHEQYKSGEYKDCEEILNTINDDLDNYSYFFIKNNQIMSKQLGVVRVNCLDCLDRTNVVQTYIAWHIFRKFFLNEKNVNYCSLVYGDDNFKTVFKNIWADNGDNLSKIYAGTGALKSSITRKGKQTVLGYLNDAKKSINRFVNNAFFDKSRQETINLLLGRFDNQKDVILHDPLSDAVQAKLQKQINKFSSRGRISIFAGTWNVNGQPPPNMEYDTDIFQWLYPDDEIIPDIYVIGIEEIVELTPQQVMSTDPEKRQIWEKEILKMIRKLDTSYIHLKSKQLVGAFISIYIREKDVEKIRNVESVLIKTGLKGLAGNKGGVAISMNYQDSSLCFVTAHLAAGQQNVEDRNRDYATISDGIIFKGGRKIKDHDIVLWLGDFNYRINNIPNEVVRQKAIAGDLDELLNNDQLINQMLEGKVFYGYQEGPITFKPTYKYDIGSDIFDSSEKARIPAWCDRILFKADRINQRYYKSTQSLRTSDHKPVKSLFEVEINIIDKETKRNIEKQLYDEQLASYEKSQNGRISGIKSNPFMEDDIDDDMYPQKKPSSENYHWWDLRALNTRRSPDTYSISSTDSFRTDSSPVHSYSTAVNSYVTSSLVNEITSEITSENSVSTINTRDVNGANKLVNPFGSDLDIFADNISNQNQGKSQSSRMSVKSNQPSRLKSKDIQSSAASSKASSRSNSISSDNDYNRSLSLPRPTSSPLKSVTGPDSSDISSGTPKSKPPKPTPPPPKSKSSSTSNTTASKPKNTKPHKPAPPPPKSKSKSSESSTPKPASSPNPDKLKPVKPAPPKPNSSNSSTPKPKPNKIPPMPAAKPESLIKSNTMNSISSLDKIKSNSSSVSSLIESFNNNAITNRNSDEEDNKSNDNSNTSNSSPDENLVVSESNVKPSAFKNGIFDINKNEEKKLTKSATLPDLNKKALELDDSSKANNEIKPNIQRGSIFNKKKQPPPIPPKSKELSEFNKT